MAHVSFYWRSIMDIGLTIRALNYQFRGSRFDTTRWLHGHSTFHHFADGQMSTSNSWGLGDSNQCVSSQWFYSFKACESNLRKGTHPSLVGTRAKVHTNMKSIVFRLSDDRLVYVSLSLVSHNRTHCEKTNQIQ